MARGNLWVAKTMGTVGLFETILVSDTLTLSSRVHMATQLLAAFTFTDCPALDLLVAAAFAIRLAGIGD